MASDDEVESKKSAKSARKLQRFSFVISNLSVKFALDYQITMEFPMEFPATAHEVFRVIAPESDAITHGRVAPEGSVTLWVELVFLL